MSAFQPKIVGFLCNFCSYAGADMAGQQHRPVPPEIGVIRVMCSGRVDPQFVLEAFKGGADGVLVLGCHPGDCHFKTGNYNARRRMLLLHRMLDQFGIDHERFLMDWVSAAEGEKFSTLTAAFVETLRKLGPLDLDQAERKGATAHA